MRFSAGPAAMLPAILKGAFSKKTMATAAALGLVIAAMLGLYVSQPLFLRQLDNRIYDAFLHAVEKPAPSPVPVIIDIDEESLALYGQWPWPRYRMAALLNAALERDAAAVALDILLAEPDRSSPRNIREYLRGDLDLAIDFSGLPPEFEDYDRLLADTVRDRPVILGMYARFGEDARGFPEKPGETETARGGKSGPPPKGITVVERSRPGDMPANSRIHQGNGATVPLEALREAAPLGLINMNPDSDGFVRRVPLLAQADGRTYANLALRALMVALERDSIIADAGPDGLESIRVGSYTIPVSPQGDFAVPFTGPRGQYRYVGAARLLDGSLPPDAFTGNILFVGASAPGLLDIRATPFDRVYPGVEVHAATLDAILGGRSIVVPAWTPGFTVLAVILAGLIAGVTFAFARPTIYAPAALLLFGGLLGGAWKSFEAGLFLSPLYPVLTVAVQGVLMLALRFWHEERQKLVLRRAFSRYVAPEVVRRITEHQGDLFSGEERTLTIMFTDIRGFTSISEKLDPRQVVSLLNRYFTPMTALVRDSGGTLDKFIGDALMAFWNAPLPLENHPVHAVRTALAMQEELTGLNTRLREDFGVTIHMGAGVHTGKAYVGNMGSEDLVNYTLIGDNVNLTSRLEGLCAQFGLHTVVSGDTVRLCREAGIADAEFQPIDNLRVKGREKPVFIFTAMRPEEAERRRPELAAYAAALLRYQNGEFEEALRGFSELAAAFPAMGLYAVYRSRVECLLANPPAEWDGVWTLENK